MCTGEPGFGELDFGRNQGHSLFGVMGDLNRSPRRVTPPLKLQPPLIKIKTKKKSKKKKKRKKNKKTL